MDWLLQKRNNRDARMGKLPVGAEHLGHSRQDGEARRMGAPAAASSAAYRRFAERVGHAGIGNDVPDRGRHGRRQFRKIVMGFDQS
jgi:hypothetical protein